jgi:hypothetical protein
MGNEYCRASGEVASASWLTASGLRAVDGATLAPRRRSAHRGAPAPSEALAARRVSAARDALHAALLQLLRLVPPTPA